MTIFEIKWTEKAIRQWQAARELSGFIWILRNGVMGFGTSMFLVWVALKLLTDQRGAMSQMELITGMSIWLLGGLVVGLFMWFRIQKSYRKHIQNTEQH